LKSKTTIGLISALKIESNSVLKYLKITLETFSSSPMISIGEIERWRIIHCISGMGVLNVQKCVKHLLKTFDFNYMILYGTAGALSKAERGTIINPIKSLYIRGGRISNVKIDGELSSKFLNLKFRRLASQLKLKYVDGCIVTVNKPILNPITLSRISRGLACEYSAIDMETSGFIEVCQSFGVKYAVLKTISDRAGLFSPLDFILNHKTALKSVSSILFGLLHLP